VVGAPAARVAGEPAEEESRLRWTRCTANAIATANTGAKTHAARRAKVTSTVPTTARTAVKASPVAMLLRSRTHELDAATGIASAPTDIAPY
jgi:hypothetical protein